MIDTNLTILPCDLPNAMKAHSLADCREEVQASRLAPNFQPMFGALAHLEVASDPLLQPAAGRPAWGAPGCAEVALPQVERSWRRLSIATHLLLRGCIPPHVKYKHRITRIQIKPVHKEPFLLCLCLKMSSVPTTNYSKLASKVRHAKD